MRINIEISDEVLQGNEEMDIFIDNSNDYEKIMLTLNEIMLPTEKRILEDRILTCEKIAKNPKKYYGREVKGYECKNSEVVKKWKLFLADENIYIIASDYVSKRYMPVWRDNSKIYANKTDYRLSFDEIVENSRGYYKNREAIKYMLDEELWEKYAGKNAVYAIGGPTIELFAKSYNAINPKQKIEYRYYSVIDYGYAVKWDYEEKYSYRISDLISNDLYVISDLSKACGMWLASPSVSSINNLMWVSCNNYLDNTYYDSIYPGFRPIVCLKSNVRFIEEEDGSLKII